MATEPTLLPEAGVAAEHRCPHLLRPRRRITRIAQTACQPFAVRILAATSATRSLDTRSALVTTIETLPNAQQIDDRKMFEGLRHHAVIGRHDEQHMIDTAGSANIV